MLFRNKAWSVSEEVMEHLYYQAGKYCLIDKLVDLRKLDAISKERYPEKGSLMSNLNG